MALNIDEHFQNENFHKELNAFFNDLKIISVFSQRHPYLEYQESLLDGIGSVTTRGQVIYRFEGNARKSEEKI